MQLNATGTGFTNVHPTQGQGPATGKSGSTSGATPAPRRGGSQIHSKPSASSKTGFTITTK